MPRPWLGRPPGYRRTNLSPGLLTQVQVPSRQTGAVRLLVYTYSGHPHCCGCVQLYTKFSNHSWRVAVPIWQAWDFASSRAPNALGRRDR